MYKENDDLILEVIEGSNGSNTQRGPGPIIIGSPRQDTGH